jgi:hypothetical protein
MTPEQEVARAGEAQRILDTPMFKEACERIESSLAEQRRRVPMVETEMHTRLIIAEQLWNNLIDYFKMAADSGKFAEFALRQQREQEKVRKGLFGGLMR